MGEDVGLFIGAVLVHWFFLLSGGVVMFLVGLVERVRNGNISWRWYISISFLLLFSSFFLAWRDEHKMAKISLATANQLDEKSKLVVSLKEKLADKKIDGAVTKPKDRENLIVEAKLEVWRDGQDVRMDITNTGDVDLVLDRSILNCDKEPTAFMEEMKEHISTRWEENGQGSKIGYEDNRPYRLEPGAKKYGISGFRTKNREALSPKFVCEDPVVEVITTLGNRFKGTVKK